MPDIRGIFVESAGTYVALDDVVASIREYAQSLEDPNAGAAIHELASWLGASSMPAATAGLRVLDETEISEERVETEESSLTSSQGANQSSENVYRIELYPIEMEPGKMRWYARTVDAEGTILRDVVDSFDYEYVYKIAHEQYPEVGIQQLSGPMDDSVFMEHQERKAFPTAAPMRERVSPKRMFA